MGQSLSRFPTVRIFEGYGWLVGWLVGGDVGRSLVNKYKTVFVMKIQSGDP